MASYSTTIRTSWDLETAFEYLATFDNISDWDPGVNSAECVSDHALEPGARFDLELNFAGRSVPITYETISIERPHEVVLRAENAGIVSLDKLSFDPAPEGGTAVTYDAQLDLKGPLKLGAPILQLVFNRLGDAARDGLAERLAGPSPSPSDAPRATKA